MVTRYTNFKTTFDAVNEYSKMISELACDPVRNTMICEDIEKEVRNNNVCLVLSDRKLHCQTIQEILEREDDFRLNCQKAFALFEFETNYNMLIDAIARSQHYRMGL